MQNGREITKNGHLYVLLVSVHEKKKERDGKGMRERERENAFIRFLFCFLFLLNIILQTVFIINVSSNLGDHNAAGAAGYFNLRSL